MMSRRGGKRRQVLQLGDSSSSKLHRYGYSKGFQLKENSGAGLPLTLVGDYSDSDSEDKTTEEVGVSQQYNGEAQDETLPVEPEPVADVNGGGGGGDVQDHMDDALRNFLSEIEAIPMPDETKTPESIHNSASPAPSEPQEEPHEASVGGESAPADTAISKKKNNAYSMFVKGEMEFAHSPAPSEPTTDACQEEHKEKLGTDIGDLDIPEEPTTLWQMVQDEATQYYYYWNWQTNEVTWEIPSDYTQYLLLHKEYQVKMAKFTPQQLQAIKEKKEASKTKQTKSGSSKDVTTVDKHDAANLTKLDSDRTKGSLGKDFEERSHSHHHKKKKSKKHKRRHGDSDEDIDGLAVDDIFPKLPEQGAAESSTTVVQKTSNKSKATGPQTVSIVPYWSDNEDEDEEDEEEGEKYNVKPDLDPPLAANQENSSRSSPAPELSESLVEHHKSMDKLDTDSLLQDLVDFADSVTGQGASAALIAPQPLADEKMETNVTDGEEEEMDVKTDCDTTHITSESIGFGKLEKLVMPEKEAVVEESSSVKEELLDGDDDDNSRTSLSTESKNDSNIEELQLPVKKKEAKVKKEIINMFEDASPPSKSSTCDIKEEVENDIETELPAAKLEIEEGEISDSLDSLVKTPTSLEATNLDSHQIKKKKTSSSAILSSKESPETSQKESVGLLKGIVGYSEDDEEEEGELKEEMLKAKIREELRLLESKRRDRKRDHERERKKSDKNGSSSSSKESKSISSSRDARDKVHNASSSSTRDVVCVHSRKEKELRDRHSRDKDTESKSGKDSDKSRRENRDNIIEVVRDRHSKDKNVQEKGGKTRESRDKELQDQKLKDKKLQDQKLKDKELQDQKLKDKKLQDQKNKDKELQDQKNKDKELQDQKNRNKEIRDVEMLEKTSKDKELKQGKKTIVKEAVIPEAEEKKPPVKEEESVIDDTEDLDFDDLDDLDRVLEMALEKKRDQKIAQDTNKREVEKKTKDTSEVLPQTTAAESKTLIIEPEKTDKDSVPIESKEEPSATDTDKEELKFAVKDSAELALNKLRFLDITTKNLSKLQVLLIELQTRLNDWQGGGLSTSYFHQQLQSSEALLSQYEESAVPSGWLCQWDRASSRYFYQNHLTNHTQWEYPEVEGEPAPKGKDEDKEVVRKKRRSKEEEREEVKSRGGSSSRSNRHRSKKTQDKERSKRDRHSSSNSHHHRKKKRRRRDHSSSSSSSEDEEESSQSRHRHRGKRKKRSKLDKSPSLEVIGESDGAQHAQVIEDSPPPSSHLAGSEAMEEGDDSTTHNDPLPPPPSILVADYGSEQDVDKEEEEGEMMGNEKMGDDSAIPESSGIAVVAELKGREEEGGGEDEQSLDGEEMTEKEGGGGTGPPVEEQEQEEEVNTAVIIRAPQIIVQPSYVAAMNQPQMYAAPSVYPSSSASISSSATLSVPPSTTTTPADNKEGEAIQPSEGDVDKGNKKKKKDKAGKEKSLTANSSIMMKKKRVSSMVQKWQQVKKEVEKEDRAKELRQAAIREKINQLK